MEPTGSEASPARQPAEINLTRGVTAARSGPLLTRRRIIKGAALAAGAGAALYVKPELRPLEVPVAQAFSF
jgi:hypothetical protein